MTIPPELATYAEQIGKLIDDGYEPQSVIDTYLELVQEARAAAIKRERRLAIAAVRFAAFHRMSPTEAYKLAQSRPDLFTDFEERTH